MLFIKLVVRCSRRTEYLKHGPTGCTRWARFGYSQHFKENIFVDVGVKPEAVKIVPEVEDRSFFNLEKVNQVFDLASNAAFELTNDRVLFHFQVGRTKSMEGVVDGIF